MVTGIHINDILSELRENGIIDGSASVVSQLTGTTDGKVYAISVHNEPKYILKLDHPHYISLVEQFHRTYWHSNLLQKRNDGEEWQCFVILGASSMSEVWKERVVTWKEFCRSKITTQ